MMTEEDIRRAEWDASQAPHDWTAHDRAVRYFEIAAQGSREIQGLPRFDSLTEQLPLIDAIAKISEPGPDTKWLLAQTEALKRIRDGEFICRCGGTIGAKGYQCAFCTEECLSPIGGAR